MNSENQQSILEILETLGLTQEQSQLYLLILQNPEISVSKMAKTLKIGRTKTYRIIDELKDINLLNEVKKQSGSAYSAQSYENLQSLIAVRQTEIEKMKTSFKSLSSLLELSEEEKAKSGITSFSGVEGLKQVIWNTTKAKGILKVFESARLNILMDFGFAEDVRVQYAKNNIRTKDLTNEEKIEGWTNIKPYLDHLTENKYISPKELDMAFEIYLYNDTVTLIDYKEDDLFCVEIKNVALKMIMEDLFDFIWKRAQRMIITGDMGEMEVDKSGN